MQSQKLFRQSGFGIWRICDRIQPTFDNRNNLTSPPHTLQILKRAQNWLRLPSPIGFLMVRSDQWHLISHLVLESRAEVRRAPD
ncbi:hypothetical protein [Acaryochloris thomasi]|nr:hypothetical protein [Acaryochloris thomasi]